MRPATTCASACTEKQYLPQCTRSEVSRSCPLHSVGGRAHQLTTCATPSADRRKAALALLTHALLTHAAALTLRDSVFTKSCLPSQTSASHCPCFTSCEAKAVYLNLDLKLNLNLSWPCSGRAPVCTRPGPRRSNRSAPQMPVPRPPAGRGRCPGPPLSPGGKQTTHHASNDASPRLSNRALLCF